MGKIPEKVLKWRAKQPEGKIMSSEKFHEIERSAKGATDPEAVAGAAYWTTLMAKYRKSHCEAVPL